VIVYFGQFFEKYRSSPNFLATFPTVHNIHVLS
jgi:hypothetical protein